MGRPYFKFVLLTIFILLLFVLNIYDFVRLPSEGSDLRVMRRIQILSYINFFTFNKEGPKSNSA